MKNHYLKSMTDFVISQWDKDITREEFSQRMIRKAKFLKRQPTKGDFVPCDLEGNALDEPKQYLGALEFAVGLDYENAIAYKEAKEKVLFKGFTMSENYIFHNGSFLLLTSKLDSYTLEDLLKSDTEVELTDNAAKMFGYE